MPQPLKDFLVSFDEYGQIESSKDITNPAVSRRRRQIVVTETTAGKAEKVAKTLYTLAK